MSAFLAFAIQHPWMTVLWGVSVVFTAYGFYERSEAGK